MKMRDLMMLVAGLTVALPGQSIFAQFVPNGLSSGDPYHLVFATRDTTDATDSLISQYNNFVQSQAALNAPYTGTNFGVQYFAIASTTNINANANAAITAPVFNFNGDKVADSYSDMWDGTLDNAIKFTQFGVLGFPDVWTGTDYAGVKFLNNEMGSTNVRTGLATSPIATWISDSVSQSIESDGSLGTPLSMYALSQQLIATPEPNSFMMFGVAMFAMSRRRRLK